MAGSAKGTQCPAGSFCVTGSVAPTPCKAGENCPAGSISPMACHAGAYCSAGSTGETQCPAGSFCLAAAGAPTPCKIGQFCAPGTATNASDQLICPALYFCSSPTNRTLCQPGRLCIAGSTNDDVECPSAQFCPNDPRYPQASFSCGWGEYCPAGSGQGIACGPGTFCPTGSSEPIDCPKNTYNDREYATHSSDCIPCSHTPWIGSPSGANTCTFSILTIALICLGSLLLLVCCTYCCVVGPKKIAARYGLARSQRLKAQAEIAMETELAAELVRMANFVIVEDDELIEAEAAVVATPAERAAAAARHAEVAHRMSVKREALKVELTRLRSIELEQQRLHEDFHIEQQQIAAMRYQITSRLVDTILTTIRVNHSSELARTVESARAADYLARADQVQLDVIEAIEIEMEGVPGGCSVPSSSGRDASNRIDGDRLLLEYRNFLLEIVDLAQKQDPTTFRMTKMIQAQPAHYNLNQLHDAIYSPICVIAVAQLSPFSLSHWGKPEELDELEPIEDAIMDAIVQQFHQLQPELELAMKSPSPAASGGSVVPLPASYVYSPSKPTIASLSSEGFTWKTSAPSHASATSSSSASSYDHVHRTQAAASGSGSAIELSVFPPSDDASAAHGALQPGESESEEGMVAATVHIHIGSG
jgi:hypothetical protein